MTATALALALAACSTSTTGEAGSERGGSSGSSASTSNDSASYCDLHRDGWCTCGPKSIWDQSTAIAACAGYSCCYRFTRPGASYSECACTNEVVSCSQTAANVNGTVVSSCPDGAPSGTSSSSSGGSTSSSGGGTCGEACSAGCCSTNGLICCKPPFCDGNCAGSPCC